MSGIFLGMEARAQLRDIAREFGATTTATRIGISVNALRNAIHGQGVSFSTFTRCAQLLRDFEEPFSLTNSP